MYNMSWKGESMCSEYVTQKKKKLNPKKKTYTGVAAYYRALYRCRTVAYRYQLLLVTISRQLTIVDIYLDDLIR